MEKKKKPRKPREETKQEKTEEKDIDTADAVVEEVPEQKTIQERRVPEGWIPKTELGKKVFKGEVKDIEKLFKEGIKIAEPEIVDVLIPNLENEIILIGGSTGKGGGIRRTISKRTTRMHKSGRRYKTSALIVVGNKNGYVGLGFADGQPAKTRQLISKALQKAKLNIIPIKRGCGSWECGCGEPHSIPFSVEGKLGSVTVELKPAPKGIKLCVSDEVKKIIRLAGIRDVWCKTRGQTATRINLLKAVFYALRKLNKLKVKSDVEKRIGIKLGKAE